MRIVQINTVYPTGSTGKIVKSLQECAEERGHTVVPAHRFNERGGAEALAVSSWLDCHVHNRLATITGLQGCFSILRTRIFLRKLRSLSPDLIHLHNIHGSYINHRLLFNFIKKYKIPVVWTLHDCWSFTGGCPHFIGYACDKWKDGCHACAHFKQNKSNCLDTSSYMWKRKRAWFADVPRMTLVCPSGWLSELVEQSFLKEYPKKVINNGIDLEIFKPTESDFRRQYGLENHKIVLGVSFGWNDRKGLDVFRDLAQQLPKDYKVVLVGTDEATDTQLPKEIISIHRTKNQAELAEIYSAADVFVNPTREDTYPTVNMEALACGTAVVTFRTGGSPETVDATCGSVVDCDDGEMLKKEIIRICTERPYAREICRRRAEEAFDKNRKFKEYIDLYERIVATGAEGDRI